MNELRITETEDAIRVYRESMLSKQAGSCHLLTYSRNVRVHGSSDMCPLPAKPYDELCSDCEYQPEDVLDAIEMFWTHVRSKSCSK